MKKLFLAVFFTSLISAGLSTQFPVKSNGVDGTALIGEVRRAHNAPRRDLSAWTADAVRLSYYSADPGGEFPGVFARRVSVSVLGDAFKRDKTDPLGVRREIDVFDGRVAHHSVIEGGRAVEDAAETQEPQLRAIESTVKAFGLIPFLKQLADPAVRVVYSGQTAETLDKFEVRTGNVRWALFTDKKRLIRRVEIGSAAIEFGDYRSVDGSQLPFSEKVSVEGRHAFELVFTEINLNPAFSPDYFSREALHKETVRQVR